MVSAGPMIEFRRLHRFFGETRAVEDVSFTVERGHVFGYIGPNGAGKTTSMRILATLDMPTFGDAYVDGFSVIDDPDRVRRRMGFMPDHFGTYSNINCREYLDFFARAYGLRGAARLQALSYVMDFTQLDQLAEKPISGLSKGMKQRLCLGRTMINDPAVLIMDEPAAGLDPRARIELREMIRRLASDGKTVLVSSHILTELAEMCDTVGIIEKGRMLAVGSVADIQKKHASEQLRVVKVRVLGTTEPLVNWLQTQEQLTNVAIMGEIVQFSHAGDVSTDADLLRTMIQASIHIAAFGSQETTLEEVFLKVTAGLIQ